MSGLYIDTASVAFDGNSPRVVRSNGVLAQQQEFTDRVHNGILDAAGNGRGRVRFILQDGVAAGAYYLYFDIGANGLKPPSPASVINGDFENSAGATATSWVTSAVNAGGNQNNEVHAANLGQTVNVPGGCGHSGANGVDASPNSTGGAATGRNWHLLGYRDACEDGSGSERIRLSRDLAVPAGAAAGVLELFFQVQGWDGINNAGNYDWIVFLRQRRGRRPQCPRHRQQQLAAAAHRQRPARAQPLRVDLARSWLEACTAEPRAPSPARRSTSASRPASAPLTIPTSRGSRSTTSCGACGRPRWVQSRLSAPMSWRRATPARAPPAFTG